MKQDLELLCGDCNRGFTWTVGEQDFMEGLVEQGKIKAVVAPKRCSDCRQRRKNAQQNGGTDNH